MAKFYGEIGYRVTEETAPGVWRPRIVKRNYYGDIIRNKSTINAYSRGLQDAGKVNDDVHVSNEISIVADAFANENFHNIIYVVYLGTKWKVNNVDVQRPRLNLTLGSVYNGD